MKMSFDLISDLHVETWGDFDWTGQPTSPYCIVAGDVSKNRQTLIDVLTHLGNSYAAVFYIDGNDEHRNYIEDLGQSYKDLDDTIKKINNVVFMQDNVVIINGVAILATNGWWTYDFDTDGDDFNSTIESFQHHVNCSIDAVSSISSLAYHDSAYLANSVHKLQTHQEVGSIVLVTHTVPAPWIAEHDLELVGTWRYNCLGNQHMQAVLNEDTENKIKNWCFGHYHRPVDRFYNGINYVSNPRGRANTPWSQPVFYPRRIEVEV
jgi:hypothetical protein